MKKKLLAILELTGICMTLIACGSQNSTESMTKEKGKDVSVQEEVQKYDESDDKKKKKK